MSFRSQDKTASAKPSLVKLPPPAESLRAHDHLNFLRGIASIAVMIGHARLALVRDTSEVPNLHAWEKPLYFLTNQGYASVMVFFVLSGFLIGSSVLKSFASGTWSWRRYFSARFARIYTVLVPALVVGVTIDLIGIHLFSDRPTYAGLHNDPMFDVPVRDAISPGIFVGNLLNLQEMYVHTLGSNRPLWSLANEWWYYVIFPIAVSALLLPRRLAVRLGCAGFAVLGYLLLPPDVRLLALVWLMGAAVSLLPRIEVSRWMIPACLTALICVLVAGSLHLFARVGVGTQSLVLGLITATLVYLICSARVPSHEGRYRTTADFLSRISYSLYLCHTPLVTLVAAIVLTGSSRMLPDVRGTCAVIGLSMLAFGYAATFHLLFESRTAAVRRWLDRRLHVAEGPRVRR